MRDRKKSQKAQDYSEKNTQTPLAPNLQAGDGNVGEMPSSIHPLLLGATAAALHSSKQEDAEDVGQQKQHQFVYMHDLPISSSSSSKLDHEDSDKTGQTATNKNTDDSTPLVSNDGKDKDSFSEKTAPVHKLIRDPYVDIGSKDPSDGDKLEQNNRHAVASVSENDKDVKKENSQEEEKEKETKSEASTEHKDNKDGAETEVKNSHKEEETEDKSKKLTEEQKEKTNNSSSFGSKDGGKSTEDQKSDAKEDTEKLEKAETTSNQEKEQNKFNKEDKSNSNEDSSASSAMVSLLKNQDNEKQHHSNDKQDDGESKGDEDSSSILVDKILEKDKAYTSKLTSDLHQQLSSDSNSDEEKEESTKNDDDSSKQEDREIDKDHGSGEDKMSLMLGKVDKAMNNSQDKEDDNIKKLIHHIKEKLAAKSSKKHKDAYAEIGSPGKRDKNGRYTISRKPLSNKHRKHYL